MRRAFVSLYIIIVAAILLIGWGMDTMWAAYNPQVRISEFESALVQVLEKRLSGLDETEITGELQDLSRKYKLEFSSYGLDELSSTDLGSTIIGGEPVLVHEKNGSSIIYKRVNNSKLVLAIKGQNESVENNSLYFIFLIAFYLGLALVVYVWVWPLSRDLNRLEKQSRFVGKDGAAPLVELRRGSHVQMLADAFNSMSIRIKELLASRKEMTYAVSHELRTPLARMKFALEMAAETQDAQLMRQQLLSVREDVNALDKFVSELLTYASFDQSTQNLEMAEGDFLEFCQSIVAGQQNENIAVEVLCSEEKYNVHCDWQLMERVLTNLLQNALRYAHSKIQIRLEKNAQEFIVIVDDDGPGIPQMQREKAFQSFVRLESGARVTKGYGLGLAIVKRILQWHKGNVRIDDSPLGGARFVIHWPLAMSYQA